MNANSATCFLSCLSLYCYLLTLYIGVERCGCLAFGVVFPKKKKSFIHPYVVNGKCQ